MKKFLLLFSMLLVSIGFGQNRSDGTVLNTIPNSNPSIKEVFRFDDGNSTGGGLVTQLISQSSSTPFGFANGDQWFSLGSLKFNGGKLYGLRFQRKAQGITLGFESDADDGENPQRKYLQWVGGGASGSAGDFSFRVADNPTTNTQKQVMLMRSDASSLFGYSSEYKTGNIIEPNNPLIPPRPNGGIKPIPKAKVEIFNTDNNDGLGVIVKANLFNPELNQIIPVRSGYFKASGGSFHIGVESDVSAFGLSRNRGTSFGIITRANAGENAYGIYAEAKTTSSNGDSYAGYFNGDIGFTGSLINLYDRRLKSDIAAESSSTLSKLKDLNPVTYNMKEIKGVNFGDGLQHGFIAQELKEVYPELVKEIQIPNPNKANNEERYYGVNYLSLISILTKGIQELNTEVEALRDQVENNTKTYVVYTRDVSVPTMQELEEKGYFLAQNTPNPFTGRTVIDYAIPSDDKNASIFVMDLNGQVIKEFSLNQEKGSIVIEAGTLNKGLYLYSLISNNTEIITKKMIAK